MEAHALVGAGSWPDLWFYGKRSHHWIRFAVRTYDPMGDPCWGTEGLHPMEETHMAAAHELQPVGRIEIVEINVRLCRVGGPWAWDMERSPPPEKEEMTETMCDDLIVTP